MPDRLIFMLSKVQSRIYAHFKQELKKSGISISPGQIAILLSLERDRLMTMGGLAKVLDIDGAAISRLVDKLEKQQLVERRINLDDRRQIQISITESGLKQAAILIKMAKSANQKIKEGFTKEEMETYKRINMSILEKF